MTNFYADSLMAMVNQEIAEGFAHKPIKVLGEVILLLEAQPKANIVSLDFTNCNPAGLSSYRGYYKDLALDFDLEAKRMTVKRLLKMFKEADGQTYTGYKGGDFIMNRKTLVWVSPYGLNNGRMLADIKSEKGITTICTEEDED